MQINLTVSAKRIAVTSAPEIICGNSDYTAVFALDSEWDEAENIAVHITYLRGGIPVHTDVLLSSGACELPAVYDTDEILIGVHSDTIQTSTPAAIPCRRCVTDLPGEEAQAHDIFNELMTRLNQILHPCNPGEQMTVAMYTHAELAQRTHRQIAVIQPNI